MQSARPSSSNQTTAPPRAPVASPGFFWAFSLPYRTVGYLVRRPSLWPLSSVPTLIFFLLWAGLFAGFMAVVEHLISAFWLTKLDSVLGAMPGLHLARWIGGAISGYTAYKATKVLSAVPLDMLGEKVERMEEARPLPRAPWIDSVGRSVRVSLFGLALLLLGTWCIGALTAVFPPIGLVTGPMQIALIASTVAWDMLDYPYGRRHFGVRARLHAMREHGAASLGFGCGYLVMLAVPGMIFVAIVVGSVAATRLVIQNERAANT